MTAGGVWTGIKGQAWLRAILQMLLLFCFVYPSWAEVPVPHLNARVTDLTATLDASVIQALEGKLMGLEQAKGAQIAVLIVATTQPESIEQYGLRVAENWKLGRKGIDDGALLLVAKNDHTLRIEVGYGLEGAIPDVLAKRIIAEIIVPRFKVGDYAGGIDAGVDALINLARGVSLPPPRVVAALPGSGDAHASMAMLLVVFFVGGILRALFGRLIGAGVAAGVAFLGAWMFLGSLIYGLLVALIAFVVTLSGGRGVAGFSGGGFGGGGGGGFSGGGGGFGGGGASGRW